MAPLTVPKVIPIRYTIDQNMTKEPTTTRLAFNRVNESNEFHSIPKILFCQFLLVRHQ